MTDTIRVWAVGDARLPVPGMAGRFVARAPKTHEPLSEGALVPDDGYHRRALARREITLDAPAAAPRASKVPAAIAPAKEAP